jgi:hypothetical protein
MITLMASSEETPMSTQMSTQEIKRRIMELQDVQRSNRPDSAAWQEASRELQPLFAEMGRRFPVTHGQG